MASPKTLQQFRIGQNDDGATLTIETDDGSTVEVEATLEQLEIIADALEDFLSTNDDTTEVKEEA
jgi:hypothetical protein